MEEKIMNARIIRIGTFLTLAGFFLCACSQEPAPEKPKDCFVLSASSDEVTRTALVLDESEPTGEIVWKTGDQISVNGLLSDALTSSDDGKKQVDFTVNGTPSSPYYVLYPGTSSTNVISLPSTQNYVENSFDSDFMAAYGTATKKGEKYGAQLKNFCGVIRFALKGSTSISRIELNSLGSEKLYGDFTLEQSGGAFTGVFSGGTSGTLTYSFGSDLALSGTDKYVYIALPAQTYASGLEALVYQSDGAFMRLKFWGNGYTLKSTNLIEFESKTFSAGRTENLLAIGSLVVENGGEPTVTPPGITVATFNVMRMEDDDRPSAAVTGDPSISGSLDRPANAIVRGCSAMQAAIGQAIYRTNADLIGFQEIGSNMYASGQTYSIQDMANAEGANYSWRLDFPSSKSGSYHYSNGFAYKSSVLTLEDSGRAWLRTSSAGYSTSSDDGSGSPNRYVVWALFTHKVSGKQFYFFVTQLPTYGQDGGNGTSNLNMSAGVNAFAATKTLSPNRQILVGDINSTDHSSNQCQAGAQKLKEYWTDAYEAVNAAGNLSSFYQTYSGTQSGTGGNYQYDILRFCKNHPERRLDHILTKGSCTAQSYSTVRNTYTFGEGDDAVDCAPSDHLPVVAYITLD